MSPSSVLTQWYAGRSPVRRLWAFSEPQGIRVIVTLVPTNDGADTYPIWLAHAGEWVHELQRRLGRPVHLEIADEPLPGGLGAGADDVLIAQLTWRDPTRLQGIEKAEGLVD